MHVFDQEELKFIFPKTNAYCTTMVVLLCRLYLNKTPYINHITCKILIIYDTFLIFSGKNGSAGNSWY